MWGACKKAGKVDWSDSKNICSVAHVSFCRCHCDISANFLCPQHDPRSCGPMFCTTMRVWTAPAKHATLCQAGKWDHELMLLLLLGGRGAGLTHLPPHQSCARPWIVPGLVYAPGLPHMNNPTLCRLAHGLRWTAKISVYFFWVWQRHLIAPTVYFSAELFNAYVTESKAWFAPCGSSNLQYSPANENIETWLCKETASSAKTVACCCICNEEAEKHPLPTEMLLHFVLESGNLELKAAELHGQHGKNLFYVGAAIHT